MSDIFQLVREVLQYRLFEISGTAVNLMTLLTFALIIAFTFLISHLLQKALYRFFRTRGVKDEASLGVTTRLLHYLILAIGLGVGIHTLGINLTALFAAGAIFAVGIGFAMQNIAQNFVSGIILLAERTIKPSDILEVEGRIVRVVRLGARATVARTLDEEDLIIPNSILVQSVLKNYTLRDALYRLRAPVGVIYGSDMALVRQVLEETARDLPWRAEDTDPVVFLTEFGDSSVNFEVSVWVDNPWQMRGLRSKLNEAIWWGLKGAGITIAFPQLDVHFDPPVVESLRTMSRS
ncbi:MAG: mechanosensitive ion channel [Candidatus Latescibacteria bacterium]|nr:mechanosensitive ion channel [Candidatus Latescibacterota bacterium]NIO57353.1 mechanosensitive ion channel [Candidatus Latescibacterota bacterium]